MPVSNTAAGETLSRTPLSEEEMHALQEKQKVQDALLQDAGKAKYKIEVLFGKGLLRAASPAGALTFWESGTKLHGGGDVMMYICPGKSTKRNECEAFIPEPGQSGVGFLVCPKCFTSWKGSQVTGQLLFRLPLSKWAEVMHKYFIKLEGNVDFVMKYYPGSLIVTTAKEQDKQRFGEEFGKIRGQRTKRIYPLANIIKDTAAGADLHNRILAFLRA